MFTPWRTVRKSVNGCTTPKLVKLVFWLRDEPIFLLILPIFRMSKSKPGIQLARIVRKMLILGIRAGDGRARRPYSRTAVFAKRRFSRI